MRHTERHALHHSKDFQLLTTRSVLPRHITNGFVWEAQAVHPSDTVVTFCFLFSQVIQGSGYVSAVLKAGRSRSATHPPTVKKKNTKNIKGSSHTQGTSVWRGGNNPRYMVR